ncbi:MAG: Efflux transporter, RND family, MFP subunit [Microgenomates group bacterium GW2011_GWA2_47_8]|nr:MAG: Efflux transporter, RND family, MFP subunit [Microgenomates group bacterium GW2011_GWA2_47_8]
MNILESIKKLSTVKKIVLVIIILSIGWFTVSKVQSKNASTPQYSEAQVERGTFINSITSSGSITSGNNLSITTSATGTVNHVYVKNGDTVKKGQKIADITLDQDSLQKQTSAWASYLGAKNSLDSAKNKLNSLQAAEFSANQKFINDAVARGLTIDDPTYIQENATWLQAENDYKNQTGVISQAQVSLTSSWYSYQAVSSSIISPAAGIISNLMIAPGSVISAGQVGAIKRPDENTQASVTLSEIDATKVNPGQKVTITMDAFPDKTFTGKVIIVNTNGQVSSGVTSYPATIQFDTSTGNIYPNMGVNVKIITEIKDNVLLVPSSAIQTSNGQKTIRILKSGQLINIPVEVGGTNDTQTEIISGINEGDLVVTSVTTAAKTTTSTTTSPFGGLGGNRNFGGAVGR